MLAEFSGANKYPERNAIVQKYIKLCAKWILTLSLVGFCGCANETLHSDFTNYSAIYGDESNKQLLLNLARLANEDPVYYIQLGSISSEYQITTSLQFTSGNTRTTTEPVASSTGNLPKQVANALALSGQANLGAVQTPIFSFVPLTGTNMVQAVLAPINDKLYLTFFDQGFAADLIARTIISRLEWQHVYTNAVGTNFTTGGITIQTKGLDPKVIADIINSRPNYAVSYDTSAYLIRTRSATDTNTSNLITEITNSIISSNDISWGMNSFIVQGKALSPRELEEITNADPNAISVYTNSITIQTTNFEVIDTNFLLFVQSVVPANAITVSKIIANKNSTPQNVLALLNNPGLINAVSSWGGTNAISLALLGSDVAAYVTNSIFTNCVKVTTNLEILVNNPRSPTYWKFLQFCADLRDAQSCRMLTVDTLSGNTTTNVIYAKDKRNPALADVASAIGANLSVAADTNGNIIVSQTQQTPHFADRSHSRDFSPYNDSFNATTNGFTYDTDPANLKIIDASNLVQDIINKRITVATRTLESAMYWTARQEIDFDQMKTNVYNNSFLSGRTFYTNDNDGPYVLVTSTNIIGTNILAIGANVVTIGPNTLTNIGPDIISLGENSVTFGTNVLNIGTNSVAIGANTVTIGTNIINVNLSIVYRTLRARPTMILTYDRYQTTPVLCSIKYQGNVYRVADAVDDDQDSNQEVFTMLSYLFAQTAISTQNLPVQQLIQVQ